MGARIVSVPLKRVVGLGVVGSLGAVGKSSKPRSDFSLQKGFSRGKVPSDNELYCRSQSRPRVKRCLLRKSGEARGSVKTDFRASTGRTVCNQLC